MSALLLLLGSSPAPTVFGSTSSSSVFGQQPSTNSVFGQVTCSVILSVIISIRLFFYLRYLRSLESKNCCHFNDIDSYESVLYPCGVVLYFSQCLSRCVLCV